MIFRFRLDFTGCSQHGEPKQLMVPCIQTLKADIMIDKLTVGFILELMSYKHEDKGP